MKTYTKNYIGKGTQVPGLNIVKITLKMEDAEPYVYLMDGQKYLTFELATLKEADKFKRTHTCYVSTPSQVQEPAPSISKKRKK